MVTPVERPEPTYAMDSATHIPPASTQRQRSSDDDGTYVGEELSQKNSNPGVEAGSEVGPGARRGRAGSHLTVDTVQLGPTGSMQSPSQNREQASRLDDDLAMLQVERQVSNAEGLERGQSTSRSMRRTRSRREEPEDEFDTATNPLHERTAIYKPPENPSTKFSRFFKKVHNSSWLVRYFTYITPLVLILLVPLLLGALKFKNASVGGVKMSWFFIWLMIVWLSLWAGRLIAKSLPYPIGLVSSLFTNNSKKWRDLGKQLELPATLFFWWLAIEISFLPTMKNHHINHIKDTKHWETIMNKVLVSFLVGITLNFVEKIIIQLIAISFHLRTYADRIELNKFQIGSLAKLYKYSKEKIAMEDSEFEAKDGLASGARTPGQYIKEAQKNTKEAFNKFGDIAGKVAGDFTGRQVASSSHPNQVVLTLLGSTAGSQILARRLYRTFARPETETVHSDDLKNAFENDEEADAAFSMFDKDMNGDISMEELEAVCVEIGRERKSITASLKDLDSVVSKLDDVFVFIVVVITILVFISLISTSAAGVLTSAGSTVLALSWLFSATAQEFLQSVIFVFVKHPFDVGDRVTIYGNTGAAGLGDDYFVKEIALLYTEFKKMEGHVVQAPNSYLNTLFILNQRRSGALAEAVPVIIKFGTTLEQIDSLRRRLLEFVTAEKREYGSNILTELRQVTEVHSLTLNVVFFYKSNWQNELLRLQRRNKFICCLMVSMQECGIEGPRMRYPGQKESFPLYMQNLPHQATPGIGHNGTPDNPGGILHHQPQDEPIVPPPVGAMDGPSDANRSVPGRHESILRTGGRARGESMAAMGRRVDFSLGMKDVNFSEIPGDIFEERDSAARERATVIRVTSPSRHSQERRTSNEVARSTSISSRPSHQFGRLQRVNTDSTQARERSNHRNRFFSRNRHQGLDEEIGMADIPESDSNDSKEKLDPRSGLISPRAVRTSAEEARPTQSSGALPDVEGTDHAFHAPTRSQTDNFEMRRRAAAMASCEHPPGGQFPSTVKDVPGSDVTMSSSMLDKGAAMLQSFKPIKQVSTHICTFAFYSHDMKRQIETHHYAARLNEDVLQCLVFDSDNSHARLIGVEYVVSERVFENLSQEEKKLWHSHTYEIKTGLWEHPGVPETVQKQELKQLAKTYGKFWCTWQFDRGDRLPLGPPALMMSPQLECPVDPGLIKARDKKYDIKTEDKAKSRKDLEGLTEVDPLADYWKTMGKGWAVVVKETDMVLPGPSPSSMLA